MMMERLAQTIFGDEINWVIVGSEIGIIYKGNKFVASLDYTGAVNYGWKDLLVVRHVKTHQIMKFNIEEIVNGSVSCCNSIKETMGTIRKFDDRLNKFVTRDFDDCKPLRDAFYNSCDFLFDL